jgi:uncharacterized coiled-coil DUF342 family protein
MSESKELINKLEEGVDALIDKVSKLSLIVKNQEEKIEELVLQNESLKNENLELTNKNKQLVDKIQVSHSGSDQLSQYKSKINELVKEIDTCISLLNK